MVDRYNFLTTRYGCFPKLEIDPSGKYVKYEDYEKLKDAVLSYIAAKIMLTTCQQQRFKQVCNGCSNYYICKVYEAYYFAWEDLQKIVKENL